MKRAFPNLPNYKSRYTEVFNLAFRRGANEREALGLKLAHGKKAPDPIPLPDVRLRGFEHGAWKKGYEAGFRMGASDAELASVDAPGAHGMIRGIGEEFLEQFGFFPNEG